MSLSRTLSKLLNPSGLILPASLANGGYELSDKNFIVNGGLNVWQRATSFSRDALSNAQFAADRFWIYSYAASSGTVDRSTDVPAGEGLLYSLASSLNASVPFGTNVELLTQGSAAPFAVNKTYVLSFWIKGAATASNLTMGINWRNVHADGANSTAAVAANPTFNVTTSWAKIVLPFTINAAPHANNRVLDFESVLPAGAKIAGWKLEPGYNETPFIHRLLTVEELLCKRYFQSNKTAAYIGGPLTANAHRVGLPLLPVAMRIAPAWTFYNMSGASGYVTEFSSQTSFTVTSASSSSPLGGGYLQCSTSFTNAVEIRYEVSAEL